MQAHGETRIVEGVSKGVSRGFKRGFKGFHLGVSGGFKFSSGNYVFVSNTSA